MHAHRQSSDPVATIGIDIGKNTFHLVGLDKRGAIVLRIKVSRSQLVHRLVNLPVHPFRRVRQNWVFIHQGLLVRLDRFLPGPERSH